MSIELKLYVVLPATIYVPETKETIPMSCGRLFAQGIHVGSKIKLRHRMDPETMTTTITLRVAGSAELEQVLEKIKKANVSWEVFLDDNKDVYGTEASLLTGISVLCSRKKGKSLFYGIESWKCPLANQLCSDTV